MSPAARERSSLLPGVSVVVPVYNSEASLSELYERTVACLRAQEVPHEIVFVDDGSKDGSWAEIERLVSAGGGVVSGVRLLRNYGQHNALLCGILRARREVVVTIDDDLQHPPEAVPGLLAELGKGFQVVYGAPEKLAHDVFRNAASWVTKRVLQGAMGVDAASNVSAFRAFRTEVCAAFEHCEHPHVNLDVLLGWGANSFSVVRIPHAPRKYGKSNYTLGKLLAHAAKMVTGFSTAPLHIASLLGLGFTLFGMGVLVYVVGRYVLQGSPVQGFPFLASIIAIFSGAQLFSLGIMGSYLANMHVRLVARPVYRVREERSASGGGSR